MTKRPAATIAVFIGRFSPFHNGHKYIIDYGLAHADRVYVLVGGAGAARRPRNPWDFSDRAAMISAAYGGLTNHNPHRLTIIPLPDMLYNDTAWIAKVQSEVETQTRMRLPNVDIKFRLLGRQKDGSGYYLKLFPQWASIDVPTNANNRINATDIRDAFFLKNQLPDPAVAPTTTSDMLSHYSQTAEYQRMSAEYRWIADYKKKHDAPVIVVDGEKVKTYPRNNICSDVVVVQAGHVLLVRRKSRPGMGMLALPGGHINRDEMPLHAAIRELKEETGIKVPEPVLIGSIEKEQTFADPYRSDLARTVSFSYLIRLKNEKGLAKLKAGSDAESAFWKPINEVKEHEMFDDHYHIIRSMLGMN